MALVGYLMLYMAFCSNLMVADESGVSCVGNGVSVICWIGLADELIVGCWSSSIMLWGVVIGGDGNVGGSATWVGFKELMWYSFVRWSHIVCIFQLGAGSGSVWEF